MMQRPTSIGGVGRRRRRWVIAGVALSGLTALAVFGVAWWRYHMAIAYQMPALAAAVYSYHQQYGVLPLNVRAVRDSGPYGLGATRLPGGWWEGWNEHSGPDVLYLPVEDWDGKTEYVIAVQPPLGKPGRAYAIAGDTSVRHAAEAELAGILARDDELRATTSQPARWHRVRWK